jgi:hypothetical protein
VQEEAIGAASIGEVMATGRIIPSCFVLARRAFQAYTGAEATANLEQAFDNALVRRDSSNWPPARPSSLSSVLRPPRKSVPSADASPMRAVCGRCARCVLTRAASSSKAQPVLWRDDSEVVFAGQAALRWRLEVDAPEGVGGSRRSRCARCALRARTAGSVPSCAAPSPPKQITRVGARGDRGGVARPGVPASAASEMSSALSDLPLQSGQAAWIEGRVEALLSIGALMDGGPDVAAVHVATWTWRAGRRP